MSEPAQRPGTLYLLPAPLGDSGIDAILPPATRAIAARLAHFVVEHPRTARQFLKQVGMLLPLPQVHMEILDEHTEPQRMAQLLAPLLRGLDVGLVSEAGCPAVADPGAALVALAHRQGIPVRPLVGPSAILLALMASGLEGQRFAFQGYLPRQSKPRIAAIGKFERLSRSARQTQIFIETPYRNNTLLGDLIAACAPPTRLCVAADLTLPGERVMTNPVSAWRRTELPDLDQHPAIFLLLAV